MVIARFFVLGFVVVQLLAMRTAKADELSDIEKVRNAYLAKEYAQADARLKDLLDLTSGTLHDIEHVAQARFLWGAVALALGKPLQAQIIFEKLLLDDPHYEPDPLSFPTDVINSFIDTRSKMRDRLNELARLAAERDEQKRVQEEEAKRRQVERVKWLEKLASEERVVQVHSRWVALIPFGVGQFQNGDKGLGYFFLASEIALLGGASAMVPLYNNYLSASNNAYQSSNLNLAQHELNNAKIARYFNLGGYAAAAFTVIAGIVHAQITFVPAVTTTRRRSIEMPTGKLAPWVVPIGRSEGTPQGAMVGVTTTF